MAFSWFHWHFSDALSYCVVCLSGNRVLFHRMGLVTLNKQCHDEKPNFQKIPLYQGLLVVYWPSFFIALVYEKKNLFLKCFLILFQMYIFQFFCSLKNIPRWINMSVTNGHNSHNLFPIYLKGAKLILGGKRHSLGFTFYEPTVISDVNSEMRISR